MREPFRHVQRAVVVPGELHRDMLQVSGAFRAKVDDDVDDRTTGAANELALGCGWTLEVHSSQRPLLPVGCNVGLCNRRLQPVVGEFLLTEGACEKPPAVLVWSEVDEKRPVQPGFGKDHHASRCRPADRRAGMPMINCTADRLIGRFTEISRSGRCRLHATERQSSDISQLRRAVMLG